MDSSEESELDPEQYVAKHNFTGASGTELSFKKGERLGVYKIDDSGWAQGEILETGVRGWFPIEFAIKVPQSTKPTQENVPTRLPPKPPATTSPLDTSSKGADDTTVSKCR
jgi:hypothetical protein